VYFQGCLPEGASFTHFIGEMLISEDEEFPERRTFIVIQYQGKTYIYDPTNPRNTTNIGKFPSIYVSDADFYEEIRKGRRKNIP